MSFEFNKQQKIVIPMAERWWKSNTASQLFELSGGPGTGKTTICKYLIEIFGLQSDEFVLCAYTGKAVMALNRKGNRAKTIHSIFYRMVKHIELDENGQPVMINNRPKTYERFELIQPDELSPRIKLIIIDEGGMVGRKMAQELLSFGIKILVLGDIDQLPPVMDAQYFLVQPDFHLTEIMRQAEGDPIVTVSRKLIKGESIEYGRYGDSVLVIPYESVTDDVLIKPDILLCGRNKTRDEINWHIRYDINKRKNMYPTRGDKIICRQNNWKESIDVDGNVICLINGLSGTVENVYRETMKKDTINIDFKPDFCEEMFYNIPIHHGYFGGDLATRQEIKNMKSRGNKFELADALTVHLSQGSEYPNVVYFKETIGFNRRYNCQLDYTAATRASKALIIVK